MATPTSRRQSTRARQSVSYRESPNDSAKKVKSMKSRNESNSPESVPINQPKTPRSTRKSVREASAEHESYSPKKLRGIRTPSKKALESIVSESSPTVKDLESSRRSLREKKSASRYSEIDQRLNVNKQKVEKARTEKAQSSDDDEIENLSENIVRSTTLFDEEEDVEGNKLYSFKTPKKKDSMALLAQHTPKTPRHNDHNKGTPKTPKNNRLSEIQKTPTSRPSASIIAKTPRHIRDATKKKLNKLNYQESDDGDFSASASDNDFDESSSDDSSDEPDDEQEDSSPKKSQSVAARLLKTPSVAVAAASTTRRSARNKGEYQYVLQPDDYFSTAKSKAKTSDHTLDRLKNPRLPHDQLMKMLANMKLSEEHDKCVKDLNEDCKSHFTKWILLFHEGYTVLLHGLGSKRNLMQTFHKERLADEHVIVINGFFPSLTIKDVLDSIWIDLLEMSSAGGNPHEIVNMIETEMNNIPGLHIYLMIHNIDGPMLRNDKAQSILSRLASIKNIHMMVSIDHINTPLLWNNTKLSNFNFIWFDVTSFLPYTEETAFENSLLVQSSGALELSSMKSVFQSLTSNARGIYILVVKHQLKNGRTPNYQGISFKELYSNCREAFLVSSDVALRAQLTEFLDHKLARLKRTADGAENITIPIKNFLLEQFLNEQN